jgi:hypothetical protein
MGGSAERNCQPSDSAVTGSVSGAAGAAGVVGGRATCFAFGLLKLSPPRTGQREGLSPRVKAWQDADSPGVTALAFCAATKCYLPQNSRHLTQRMHSRTTCPRVFVIFDSTYRPSVARSLQNVFASRCSQLMQVSRACRLNSTAQQNQFFEKRHQAPRKSRLPMSTPLCLSSAYAIEMWK